MVTISANAALTGSCGYLPAAPSAFIAVTASCSALDRRRMTAASRICKQPISRLNVESGGGCWWAEPGSAGAIFQFILPRAVGNES